MALVKVHKIMLRNTADSYTYRTMWVSNSAFDSFKLDPCTYGKQAINLHTSPHIAIGSDELYNFIIRAAHGNSANCTYSLSLYTNPNLDIYFFASDGTAIRGQITSENITFPPDDSPGTIHLEFLLDHDTNPMATRRVEKENTMEDWFTTHRKIHVSDMPGIDHIIFNNPATIVYWTDGTKTVVKAHDEEFSEEHGLAMAFARKVIETCYGSKTPRAAFKRLVREATHY